MFRKILLGFLLIIVLVVAGGWMFLKTQGDVILEKFSQLVEKNTGKPLHMEGLPEIGIFPGISLTLGPSTWGEKEDDISVSFVGQVSAFPPPHCLPATHGTYQSGSRRSEGQLPFSGSRSGKLSDRLRDGRQRACRPAENGVSPDGGQP